MEPGTIVTASPLTVRLHSSATASPAKTLDGKTYTVGDQVAVVPFQSKLLVVGKVT